STTGVVVWTVVYWRIFADDSFRIALGGGSDGPVDTRASVSGPVARRRRGHCDRRRGGGINRGPAAKIANGDRWVVGRQLHSSRDPQVVFVCSRTRLSTFTRCGVWCGRPRSSPGRCHGTCSAGSTDQQALGFAWPFSRGCILIPAAQKTAVKSA